MPLQVCHLIDSLAQGGAESLLRDIIQRSEVEHTVCYFSAPDTLAEDIVAAGGTTIGLSAQFPYDPRSLYRLWKMLRQMSADVLHVHLPYPRTVGRVIGKVAGVTSIVSTYHNPIDRHRRSVAHVVDPIVGRLDDVSVGVSNAVREDFQRRLPSNDWRTVYNGIDTKSFRTRIESVNERELRGSMGISEEQDVILSVGRYVKQKSHKTLIRALPQIQSSIPDTHLVLVGWGEQEQSLRQLAAQLDVGESVTITGRVPEVHGYYSLADVFALASSFEGFGIVAVEAMSAGIPVVASHVPGLDEVVADEETGRLVPPGDSRAFAEVITSMLQDGSKDFGERGRERAEELFDISRTVAEYDKIYSELSA